MKDLRGKWVLITGASRGIGRLSAVFMAKQGCNLILHSRKLEGTAGLLEEIKGYGVDAYSVAAELSDVNQVDAMLKEIDAKGTQVDVILNNAGLQIDRSDAVCGQSGPEAQRPHGSRNGRVCAGKDYGVQFQCGL